MPNILTDTDILDLVASTQKDLGKLRFNQIAQRFGQYEVLPRLLKDRGDTQRFDSGTGIKRTIMIDHSNAARNVGLYGQDAGNVADVLKSIEIPWRHNNTNYAIERREITMNGGASKIVDLVKVRRADAMLALTELMESSFWNKPADSSDPLVPYGVPYWIVKNASEGFNGGAPTGFAAGCGGLLHARWQNWTAQYAAVTKADLILKMRKAHRNIQFTSPVDVQDYRNKSSDDFRIYLNEATLEAMETLGEAQNENLGRDLASMDGSIVFKKIPLVWQRQLDADTSNPIYFLNFAWFAPVLLKGEFLRESEPAVVAGQHTVTKVEVDTTWNVLCTDRRRQAVIYK